MLREWKIDEILPFGKHKGRSIGEIFRVNWHYLEWAIKEIPNFSLSSATLNELENEFPAAGRVIRLLVEKKRKEDSKLSAVATVSGTPDSKPADDSFEGMKPTLAHWKDSIKKKEEEVMKVEREQMRVSENPLAGTW